MNKRDAEPGTAPAANRAERAAPTRKRTGPPSTQQANTVAGQLNVMEQNQAIQPKIPKTGRSAKKAQNQPNQSSSNPGTSGGKALDTAKTQLVGSLARNNDYFSRAKVLISYQMKIVRKNEKEKTVNFELTDEDLCNTKSECWYSGNIINFMAMKLMLKNNTDHNQTFVFTPWMTSRMMGQPAYYLPGATKSLGIKNEENKRRCQLLKKLIMDVTESRINRLDVFNFKMLVIPAFETDHWFLVVIMNPKNCRVLKSQPSPTDKCTVLLLDSQGSHLKFRKERTLLIIQNFLENQFKAKNKDVNLAFDKKKIVMGRVDNLPVQKNMNQCGPAVVHFLEGVLDENNGFLEKEDVANINWADFHRHPSLALDRMRGRIRHIIYAHAKKERMSRMDHYFSQKPWTHDPLISEKRNSSVEREPKTADPIVAIRIAKRGYSCDSLDTGLRKGPQERWLIPLACNFPFSSPRYFSQHPSTTLVRKINPYTGFEMTSIKMNLLEKGETIIYPSTVYH